MELKMKSEDRIVQWREHLQRYNALRAADIEELEDHLRSQINSLTEVGLSDDEAFLVAVKRIGDLNSLSNEFAEEYSERLWKQLLSTTKPTEGQAGEKRDTIVTVGLAIAAGVAVKLPQLFGVRFEGAPADESFYVRNISLLILPMLAIFFAWKRGVTRSGSLKLSLPFLAAALVINLIPYERLGATEVLAALHLPIALWFAVGSAYMGARWESHSRRMNFVRFSGEWVIYLVLIAMGGGVLMAFTMFTFQSIGLDAESFVQSWLLPCGIAGAIVIGGWLVEAKQSIIENMAPVLTRLFTPLFAILLISYLVAMLWSGSSILVDREVLIGFDLLLVLILGLLLYSISARDSGAPPDWMDRLQFLLVVSALLVDALALWQISKRISEFGFSPNKVAALGENFILLINLLGAAVLYAKFLFRGGTFHALERWQTAYIPVYVIWAGIVVAVFPFAFNFR